MFVLCIRHSFGEQSCVFHKRFVECYLETVLLDAGSDLPSLSSSRLIKRTSVSRLLNAGLSWQQSVDEPNPTSSTDTKVCLSYLFTYLIIPLLLSAFSIATSV